MNTIVQKFSEHYHDAWASRKMENGWVYGEQWSDSSKTHPRLKPYTMLNDYVCHDGSYYCFYMLTHCIVIFLYVIPFQGNLNIVNVLCRKKKDTKNQYANR